MESAFQSMIDQLQAALEGVPLPHPAPKWICRRLPPPPVPVQPSPAMPDVLPLPLSRYPPLPCRRYGRKLSRRPLQCQHQFIAAVPAFSKLSSLVPRGTAASGGGSPPAVPADFTESPVSGGIAAPVRRRALPAISLSLIAELDSTLAQAFSPAPGAESAELRCRFRSSAACPILSAAGPEDPSGFFIDAAVRPSGKQPRSVPAHF